MSDPVPSSPRCGEFFAPLPLAALALLVVNDVWLKPAFHSELTGKLSDVAVCFLMPLLLSELLGIFWGWAPGRRLAAGAIVTAALFVALEIVPPFTRLALACLDRVGPYLGIHRRFRMTSDWTDLACVPLVVVAVAYGRARLGKIASLRIPNSASHSSTNDVCHLSRVETTADGHQWGGIEEDAAERP